MSLALWPVLLPWPCSPFCYAAASLFDRQDTCSRRGYTAPLFVGLLLRPPRSWVCSYRIRGGQVSFFVLSVVFRGVCRCRLPAFPPPSVSRLLAAARTLTAGRRHEVTTALCGPPQQRSTSAARTVLPSCFASRPGVLAAGPASSRRPSHAFHADATAAYARMALESTRPNTDISRSLVRPWTRRHHASARSICTPADGAAARSPRQPPHPFGEQARFQLVKSPYLLHSHFDHQ